MRSRVLFAAALAGCYQPAPPEGAPCNLQDECPAPLQCLQGACLSAPPIDGAIDAPIPDAFTGCLPPVAGTFAAPTLITALSTPGFDGTPWLTDDRREIYVKSDRAGSMGGFDLWRSTRQNGATSWSTPFPVFQINSTEDDASPELSSDGLTLWFSSSRPGGLGTEDIWVATRTSMNGLWSTPVHVPELSSTGSDEGLMVMPSMLVAYFHSDRGGTYRIYRTERPTISAAWGAPVLVDLAMGGTSENPWLSADECTIYFHTETAGDLGDLVVATRTTPTGAWGAPVALTTLNSNLTDADPWVTPDQRRIYFASNRTGGSGSFDLYESSR